MYAVSLLPSEYKNYQNAIKKNEKILFIGLIAVISVLVICVTSVAIASIYDRELNRIKMDNKVISKQIDEFKPLEALKTQVSSMMDQISQAAGVSPVWFTLIRDIGNTISPKITLISFTSQYKDQTGSLVIIGNSPSQDEVSRLIYSLSNIKGLGEIKCKTSSENEMDQTKAIQFELDIQLLNGVPYVSPIGGEN